MASPSLLHPRAALRTRRLAARFALFGAVTLAVACGASSSTDVFSPDTQNAGSGGDAASLGATTGDNSAADAASTKATLDAAGGSADASPPARADAQAAPSCTSLKMQIDQLRPAAASCSFAEPEIQCAQNIDDICCKLFVTNKLTLATKSFIAAVEAFKKAKCQADCNALTCPIGPSFCTPTTGTKGVCTQ